MINIQSPSSRTQLSKIMSKHSLSLWKILIEAWRIITAHPRHFLTLSALFLLPVSITCVVYLFLAPQPTSLHSLYPQSSNTESPPVPKPQLLVSILIILSSALFSLCAIPSISYSTFAAFHDEPIKLTRSLRTIIASFFPLLGTLFLTQVILWVIIFAFGIILMLVAYSMFVLFEFKSQYFLVISITATAILMMVLLYLVVECVLWDSVVVLESIWGFAPFRRSSYLVKGNKKVVLSFVLLPSVLSGILQFWLLNLAANTGEVSKVWIFAQIFVCVVLLTVFPLYALVAKTVLYIYCKASHGETALPTDKNEYVLVPIA